MAFILIRDGFTYVTENPEAAENLSRNKQFFDVPEVDLIEIMKYSQFYLKGKLAFDPNETYKDAYRVSNLDLFNSYVRKAVKMPKLKEFDPRRVKWEEKKEKIRKLR